ncbi:MAG: DUF885 domain-containing protein [Halieaceae bacterium]|jgi:uncharacterized protein (DUF885 family)|nr:DUF885 domain-containing protein [Halieaceae bacterium]
MNRLIISSSIAILLAGCGAEQPATSSNGNEATDTVSMQSEAVQVTFPAVMADITREWLRNSPESASALGVTEEVAGGQYNNRLSKTGVAAREETMALTRSIVQRLKALRASDLTASEQQMVDVQLFRYQQLLDIDALVDYGTPYLTSYGPMFEPYAVAQMNGPHIELTSLLENNHPVTDVASAEAYIERLLASGAMLAGLEEEVLADAEAGAIPPDFIIEKAERLLRNLIAAPPQENVIYTSFKQKLEESAVDGGKELLARALDALETVTYPGYAALADTVASLKGRSSHNASLASLPNGGELYAAMMRLNTDTELTADEVHQLGLDNVARIHADMDAIMQTIGMTEGTVPERLREMVKNPDLVYPNTEEYKQRTLEEVTAMVDEINAIAPEYFGVLPNSPVEVRRVPAFREETSAAGYYNSPSADGTRPGIYYLNLRSTQLVPIWGLPTITYHEAVPGHHFQVALGLERDELPLLQRVNTNTNAFAEGWGLYAERLAWEMGMYKDKPLADIGRLYDELHRAVRLVVDTGMHAKGWSREEAIQYMAETKGAEAEGDGSEVVSEIERYVAMPGQALGYMVGMLTILELRDEAQQALGDDFDIREFHDAVLTKGGMPLPLLQADVRRTLGIAGETIEN